MNTKQVEANWHEIKTSIKAKWDKFSDHDIEAVKSDLTMLGAKIQKAYGIAKEEADRQFEEFKKTASHLLDQAAHSAVLAAQVSAPLQVKAEAVLKVEVASSEPPGIAPANESKAV